MYIDFVLSNNADLKCDAIRELQRIFSRRTRIHFDDHTTTASFFGKCVQLELKVVFEKL